MRLSDGAVIPGNRRLDDAERDKRIRLYYAPYHRAIDAVLDACLASGVAPTVLSIHSFTESWKTSPRPWHIGVLWDRDGRLAKPLLDRFYAEGDLIVGDNQPYSGQLEGDCLWQHATRRGLVNALIEVRQDLIRDGPGQRAWADRLCRVVGDILGDTLSGERRAPAHRRGAALSGVSPAAAACRQEGQDRGDQGDQAMTDSESSRAIACEAAAFRRLLEHLRRRTDVQNIDLMNLAGFCRNCLADWYREAAQGAGLELSKDAARELIYGMPYSAWQAKHQKPASSEQAAAFEAKRRDH